MRIYLASSWRNKDQPEVLAALRGAGHEVYDFRNPEPGDTGFDWAQVDLLPRRPVRAEDMRSVLAHPLARCSELLVACPKEDHEVLRSGTWATIREARKAGVMLVILLPNGGRLHNISDLGALLQGHRKEPA